MASLIPDYEYDIFISYRRKDNKHDGWVTEFVNNLKGELESSFKEDVSVYFDENPHDSLLETYDVDASLRDKLKCLVFIPILSRTYCDPKSFAWKHEFETFVDIASHDRFGLKIRLPNGYVASRVLPVRIYDLDPADSELFGSVIGGVIRSVDFIYLSPGVNRPLLPKEEKPHENLNHTNYRDQINKVGNSMKDIISSMMLSSVKSVPARKAAFADTQQPVKRKIPPLIAGISALLFLLILTVLFLPHLFRLEKSIEKSIAVLPLIYDSPADTNLYYMNAMMGNVLTHLQEIRELSPRSRTSSEKFRKTEKTIPEIAKELHVNYIVESIGQKTGNNIKLNVTLYRADKDRESRLWGHSYDQEIHDATDIFRIESILAEDIAEELNAVITPQEKKRIEKTPTANIIAYENYLLGQSHLKRFYQQNYDEAMKYFELAKEKDPDYALAYIGISEVWIMRGLNSYSSISEVTPKAIAAFSKGYELDSTLSEVHVCRSWIQNYLLYDVRGAEVSCKKALSINPNNADVRIGYANVLVTLGRLPEAIEQAELALKLDPLNIDSKGPYGVILFCSGRYEDAIRIYRDILNIDPENGAVLDNLPLALHMAKKRTEALQVWESLFSIYFKDYANVFRKEI
ncbi:MAG TPA: tetratricopeptide repeat protein, partial [Bacteroidales bacterium]|nr:tetratricopeptide repeat protein [Bacteroidales bacterium]